MLIVNDVSSGTLAARRAKLITFNQFDLLFKSLAKLSEALWTR
jgi:hypothetical protein